MKSLQPYYLFLIFLSCASGVPAQNPDLLTYPQLEMSGRVYPLIGSRPDRKAVTQDQRGCGSLTHLRRQSEGRCRVMEQTEACHRLDRPSALKGRSRTNSVTDQGHLTRQRTGLGPHPAITGPGLDLSLSLSQADKKQEPSVEVYAAWSNLATVVKTIHDPASRVMDQLLEAKPSIIPVIAVLEEAQSEMSGQAS